MREKHGLGSFFGPRRPSVYSIIIRHVQGRAELKQEHYDS